jgi:hypothetical protein
MEWCGLIFLKILEFPYEMRATFGAKSKVLVLQRNRENAFFPYENGRISLWDRYRSVVTSQSATAPSTSGRTRNEGSFS